jgi:uncharacterized SAM-binding protein YcdF (DUF218 family)
VRRWILVALLLVVALGVPSVPLFVLKSDDDLPADADAVVVLAGSESRLPVALDLMDEGAAPVLVVSDPEGKRDDDRRDLCAAGVDDYELICELPEPYSTRGEARMVARLAKERGWDSIVLVTSRFHLWRAKRLFERCYEGEIALVGSRVNWWYRPVAVAFEWAKLAVAETVRRGC